MTADRAQARTRRPAAGKTSAEKTSAGTSSAGKTSTGKTSTGKSSAGKTAAALAAAGKVASAANGASAVGAVGAAPTPSTNVPAAEARAGPSTATARVYEGIYRAVLERRLAAGAWLREEELAASFGVSRTVVRQALQRLAQHQVVELIHNRGARVPLLELADAEHVFEARRVAECEIARRLGGRLDEAQLQALRRLAEEEQRADERGDTPVAVRLSGEFHQALARMHGNPVLARLLDSLLPTTSVLMSRFAASGQPVCVAHRHVDLIDALARGGAAAALEMKRHLAELQESLTRPQAVAAPPLRDVFAAYREDAAAERGPTVRQGAGRPPARRRVTR